MSLSLAQSPLVSVLTLENSHSQCTTDDSWGPFSNCRFDFTQLFEQCILSGTPSAILLLASTIRMHQLHRQDQKIVKNQLGLSKLVFAVTHVLFQLILLIFWARKPSLQNIGTIPEVAVNLAAAIAIVPLSYLEHSRSVRPSAVLEVYLVFSSLFELPQVRTLFLIDSGSPLGSILLADICCKLALLALEGQRKISYLRPQYQALSPESFSGIIDRSLLWWLNGIFSAQYLDFLDQYQLDPALATENVGQKLQNAWDQRAAIKGRFPLIWTMFRGLGGSFAHVLLPRSALIAFTFAQPFLITSVLQLLEKPEDTNSRVKGHLLVVATLLIYLGIAISSLHSNHALKRFITTFRGATVCLIYNKTLALKDGTYDASSAVTLMGNDVDRIAFCLEELNECWSRLVEIGIGLPLLTRQLGWVSVIPLVVVGLSTIGSSVVANLIGKSQRIWSDATQRRIRVTSSMLKEMKSVKMTGLTDILGNIVQTERVQETKRMESWAWIMVWLNVFSNIPSMLAPAATFGIYAIQAAIRGSESLNTVQAFTSLALISLVSHPASRLLSAIPNTAASIGCFDRIQAFLLTESHRERRQIAAEGYSSFNVSLSSPRRQALTSTDIPSTTIQSHESPAITIRNATIRPSKTADFILKDVDLSIEKGHLARLSGAVGVGKTTLLKAILGETECSAGAIIVADKNIAYCSQSPWLINGSIKQAICGFEKEEIDETWYQTVLTACDLNYDISKLPAGDHTIIGSRGVALSGGQKQRIAIARAIYAKSKIVILDDVLSSLDKQTESTVVSQLFGREGGFGIGLLRESGCTTILVTHSTQVLPLADQIILIDRDGGVQSRIPEVADQRGLDFSKLSDFGDNENSTLQGKEEELEPDTSRAEAEVEARDLKRRTGDLAVYKYYLKSIGSRNLIIFVLFVVLNVFSGSFSQLWLKWWTDIDGRQIALYASVYLVLAIGYSVGMGGYAWAMAVVIGPATGRRLHRVLLEVVLKAPQSFFVATDLGSILNRFTQDMSLIEGQLAYGVLATVSNLFSTLAEAAFIATGSPFVVIALPPLFFVMYHLQKVYLRTSRQLRHLELESRSPVYSHFLETLEGLSTIRALGWERESRALFRERVDDSQKPYYLMFCIQNWLSLVLDLIAAGMAVTVVTLALNLRQWTSPGLLGVAMNNVLSFNLSLSAFLSGWTVLETSLGAIARLKDFEAEIEDENKPWENILPPENWPSRGLLEIEAVCVEYNDSIKALKNISLKVLPGQRVSICGRTASGKSTLLSTLLRLQDLASGTIKLDSLDLSHLPRSTIRQQITSIPQDPIQINGTLRFNTDPFGLCTDTQIISALKKVDLWSLLDERGGLDAELLPDTLSKGQLQLLALARTLLRRSKLVLMDEATSNIDSETARRIDGILREEFRNSTILTVAHRRETILSADVVVVMELGEIVEVGEPENLMGSEGSRLRALLEDKNGEGAVI